jgi:hypothetical protein
VWLNIIWYIITSVLDEPAASIFKAVTAYQITQLHIPEDNNIHAKHIYETDTFF